MSANGWIKIHRKAFKHKFWTKARVLSEFEAWIDLLQSARFDETDEIRYIDGLEVKCGHAQYPASIRFLSRKWQWGEQKVRSFLNQLKKDGSITIDCSQGVSIITICKYDNYNSPSNINNTGYNTPDNTDINLLIKEIQALKTQLSTQEITHPQHTPNTNKKKDKKDNNIISPPIIPQQGETVASAPDASEETRNKGKTDSPLSKIEEEFERFRKAYPGNKRGHKTEFENFKKKYPDYQALVYLLYPALMKLNEWRSQKRQLGQFVPEYANLQTWINKRRWEEEFEKIEESNETIQKQTKRYDDGDFLQ